MKTIPPPCPEPESGRKYWRSLDQLADTKEFREWVEREFPAGASELTDPVTRRAFVKLMSASFLLAGFGLTGCRKPEEYIYPFSKMPENYTHGVAQFYATAMPTRGSAIPLLAKSNEGRPTKVEGNPQHPDSNGGTDVFAQASVLNLYDPDRAIRFVHSGSPTTPEAAKDFLAQLSRQAQSNGGQGLCFLVERSSSPSRQRLQALIRQKFPQAKWFLHEPVDLEASHQAAALAFGKSVAPHYRLEQADVIVSLDCDFIGSENDAHSHIRKFAQRRKIAKPADSMNRLYAIESLMTLTGVNADHRLRVAGGAVLGVAARLAAEILKQGGPSEIASALQPLAQSAAGVDEKWIVECAKDLAANAGKSVVVAGYRQPAAVHLIAHAINVALGNVGKTVLLLPAPETSEANLNALTEALHAGQVETLVILGGNPVYTAPVELDWARTQRKAKTVVRLGYYEDETASACDWHLPLAHYLEAWGDARTSDGTVVTIQPLIAPLFGGMTEIEVLARIAGHDKTSPYDIIRETFQALGGRDDEQWKKVLHDGFMANSASQPVPAQFDAAAVARALGAARPLPAPSKDQLEVIFHRDSRVDDGRYANNGWLQELPDPITKITWENVILLSPKTAQDLGLVIVDKENLKLLVPLVRIQLGGREIEGPAWIQPGQADHTIGVALGYGRAKAGRVGRGLGYDAYRIRTAAAPYIAAGAKLIATGRTHELASTQNHWALEGRPIIREANLQQFKEHPDFAKRMNFPEPPGAGSIYPNPLKEAEKSAHHQWGMVIDLNSCVGCSACMVACQAENNVPIVGKQQVAKGREMHWIRIDRYYSTVAEDPKAGIANPQVVTQPMLCQHCETAPCENVCPVNATVHDQEGLNLMVYNRCVGTRYCSNNCPYKVRRFNYFDYNKRPLDKLYQGPLAKRPDDEMDLVKMVKNPDVTVRMRGVMEKCTFCVQRIEGAKIAQKIRAGASANVQVPTDSFTTACAQACPADAIVFGNLNDPKSRVVELKKQERNYTVLEFLNTQPRLTYLAKVRNPNPAMPDEYNAMPGTLHEYSEKMGHPFETHHGAADHSSHGASHAPATHGSKGAH